LGAHLPESVTERLAERFEKEMLVSGGAFYDTIVIGQKKGT